ncbi:hypothetical protein ANCCAN_19987 [Ancylostoma caninum]|uniref:Uncharacterized protein n=1 Tax=Ancylostoma caninum TaxID=29170 RepID=A0A368FV74_ANCCA|nr:hypothetical protein ANCCAN_19987 [Ancylostoma caninum]
MSSTLLLVTIQYHPFRTSRSAILSSRKAEVRVVPGTGEAKENETNDESVFSDGDEPPASTENESPVKGNGVTANELTHVTEPAPSSSMPEAAPKGRPDFDFSIEYGYQTKALRCFVLHEVAFSLVYGHKDGTKPTSYDL